MTTFEHGYIGKFNNRIEKFSPEFKTSPKDRSAITLILRRIILWGAVESSSHGLKKTTSCKRGPFLSCGSFFAVLCIFLLTTPIRGNAQNISIAPYSVWAEKHNVSGMYTSGQEVCDARYPNHPDGMVYLDYGAGDQGGCWNPVRNEWGISPGRWYICPKGYDPEGWTLFDAMPPPAYFKGQASYCIGSSNIADPAANLGIDACIANPISAGTGNKYQVEEDFPSSLFSFRRFYNSDIWGKNAVPDWQTHLGLHWRGSYDRRVSVEQTTQATTAYLNRPSGQFIHYRQSGSSWIPNVSDRGAFTVSLNTSGQAVGYLYVTADDEFEQYDLNGRILSIVNRAGLAKSFTYSDGTAGVNGGYVLDSDGNPTVKALPAGLLIRITDMFGRRITFGYDASKRIVIVSDVEEGRYLYRYDASNRLFDVTYPDNQIRQYHYNESDNTNGAYITHALTGITDERGVRYAIFKYNSAERAISSEHAGGADRHTLTYGTNSTIVTDPLGTQRTYNFQTFLGVVKNTSVSQPGGSGCGPSAESLTYDANGNIASRTDFNGKKTTYAYDLARNLETSRTEGLSSSGAALPETRTITTTWHPTWRLPVQVNEYAGASASGNPLRRTSTAYDDKGNVVSRSVTDVAAGQTRTWTTSYTYSVAVPGLILQKVEDGPRTDVTDTTVTDYYPHDEVCAGAVLGTGRDKGCRGQVKRIANALGQITQFTRYNAHGQVEEIVDPNGALTTLTYDLRQRLTSRSTAGETTSFQYDGVGQLTRLTQPDGSYIAYTYDGARRLTEVTDNLGNRIAYTLDAAGNRTREEIRDPQGALARTLTRAYDALGRMQTLTGVGNE